MNQNVLRYLRNYSFETFDVNRLLVTSFVQSNGLINIENEFINQFIITINNVDEIHKLNEFVTILSDSNFDIEELLELFEFVISPADKEVNGAVFTPLHIRDFIVKQSIDKYIESSERNLSTTKFGDIACGCGGFFKTIADSMKLLTDKSYFEIFRDNIFGVDIQNYSIERTKILLTLHAIKNGEDRRSFDFNLYQGNSLDFNWNLIEEIRENNGFDIIVGNPPYVGASKIDSETKLLLKNWSTSCTGKADLYIPFFEIGLENLNNTGVLGFITVNTFYRSLNGRSIRDYFSKNQFDLTIIDFGGEQLFKKRSTYTCICIISNNKKSEINYVKRKSADINLIKKSDYINILYDELDNFDGWYLFNNRTRKIIHKIENTGTRLGDKFEIRNGFATLKNNIYVFSPIRETENLYFLIKDGKEYGIEKNICRNAIKPNTLKSESGIEAHIEKLIFPYRIKEVQNELFETNKKTLKIIFEEELKSKFPHTFEYLLSQRETLSNRDKGSGNYEEWYSFGRNQALLISGYKLLLPYITNTPCFVYSHDHELLFYNGYAIFSDSIEELRILQKILMSKIFWFYIENTSKPYAGNYFSVAKNYIKNFGICSLTDNERLTFQNLISKEEIDNFLCKKYGIKL